MVVELHAARGMLSTIAKAMGAVHMGRDVFISRIVTHSDEAKKGDLFCAIKGKKDGFAYAKAALEKGAAVLCDRPPSSPCIDAPCLLTDDTVRALGKWARHVRLCSCVRVIAITGSVGKTSTKNAVYTMLKDFFRVHATEGNYNNLLGVPLTLLSVRGDTEILVIELGTNQKGEIKALSQIVVPNDAIITAIGRAHIEAFGDRTGVAKEKLDILCGMEGGGRLFVPESEPLLRVNTAKASYIPVAPWKAFEDDVATASAVGFAAALATAYGIDEEDIQKRVLSVKGAASRRKETEANGIYIIDDAYNASPESMLSAFRYLATRAKGRRVLVLGDMLELGEETSKIHFEIGKEAAKSAELILLFGDFKEAYQKGITDAQAGARTVWLEGLSPSALAEEISVHIRKGDTLLFKAAHALAAEKISQELIFHLRKQ